MSRDSLKESFVDRAEDLGGSIQFEFYKSAKAMLERRHGAPLSTKLAAALANYVFHFGLISPDHAADQELLAALATEKALCLSSFGDKFKSNATGVLILLGAAWQIELARFKAHMKELARCGFARTGDETPNVARELPEADQIYLYTVVFDIGSDQQA